MRIDLGSNIDASWIGIIAYSTSDSGSNWAGIHASNLTVNPVAIQPTSYPVYNAVSKQNQYKIQLIDNSNKATVLEFRLSEITNQAGWTNDQTGLNQAFSDIASWIAIAASSPVSVTYLPTPSPSDDASVASTSYRTDNLTETPVSIKASSGNLYGYGIINANPYPVYVKFCDLAAASVVVGTTPVVKTIRVPANGGQVYQDPSSVQQRFGTAISVYAVRGFLDSNTTAVTANRIIFQALYE